MIMSISGTGKKIFIASLLIALLLPSAMALASAGEDVSGMVPEQSLDTTINNLVSLLFYIILIIGVIFIIYAAFLIITAQGDIEKVNTGKSILLYVAVGIAIAFAAKEIIWMVAKTLGAHNLPGGGSTTPSQNTLPETWSI